MSAERLASAWNAFYQRNLVDAESDCQKVLALKGNDPQALFLLALISAETQRVEQAVNLLRQVQRLCTPNPDVHGALGNCLVRQGRLDDAEAQFRAAAELQPERADHWSNLANVIRDQGRFEEAIPFYRRAIQLKDGHAAAYNNLGIALARLGRREESRANYERAVELDPSLAEAQNNLGIACAEQGLADAALERFRIALTVQPQFEDACLNLGVALINQGRGAEAIDRFREFLRDAPHSSRVQFALGRALAGSQDVVAALVAVRRALELDPQFSEAELLLSCLLRDQGELEAALSHVQSVLARQPSAEGHHIAGTIHLKSQRIREALGSFERALQRKPTFVPARIDRALALLTDGNFEAGWPELDWRLRLPSFVRFEHPQPLWDGSLLDGRTILLQAEQCPEDTLQLVRFAPLVRARGGQVVVRCDRALAPVISGSPGIDRVIADDEPLPAFDCYLPFLSLPRIFNTNLSTIPATRPYLFAHDELVQVWSQVLQRLKGLRIGLAWRDPWRQEPTGSGDTLRECLPQLAASADVSLVVIAGELPAELPEGVTSRIYQLGELRDPSGGDHGSVAEIAAAVRNLDLLITVDGVLSHLGGGLGVPTWVLLEERTDWRWLLGRAESPWYPTLRLFRASPATPGQHLQQELLAAVQQAVDQPREHPLASFPEAAETWFTRGIAMAQANYLDGANESFRQALKHQPDFAPAHNALGNILMQQGHKDQGIACYRRAIACDASFADAHNNLGIVLARADRHEEAVECFRAAATCQPDFLQALNNLGIGLANQRKHADAVDCFRQAVKADPTYPQSHNNLGNALAELGDRDAALASYQRALSLDPQAVDAHNNLGNLLREQGRYEDAASCFQRALRLDPRMAEAHNNLGITLSRMGNYEEALKSYRQALELSPGYAAAHNNLGIALASLHQNVEAVAEYRKAIELLSDYAEAYNNLGITLTQMGDYQEALECYEQAIRLKPDYAEAHSNMGIALTEAARVDDALAHYQAALQLKPDYPDAHMNRSLTMLLKGDFQTGWAEYEWRWKCKEFNTRNFPAPRWDGSPLQGRRILLHAEQGLGDTLQFVRYVRQVKELGGHTIVWCPRHIIPMLRTAPYIDELTQEGEELPPIDCHLPLLSLPFVFGTRLDSVPGDTPYLFADSERVESWRRRLDYIRSFKIGIVWQGNRQFRGDRHRSIPLRHFAALAEVPGVHLISLQKGFGTEQIDQVAELFPLTQLGKHVDDKSGPFLDTAAVLSCLDLVISSDTSLAHLAGALGVPIWLGLCYASDWRWLLERSDSPWYPSMRLYRQSAPGNWPDVFRRMANDLADIVAGERAEFPHRRAREVAAV